VEAPLERGRVRVSLASPDVPDRRRERCRGLRDPRRREVVAFASASVASPAMVTLEALASR
jgi:hypothetical protein